MSDCEELVGVTWRFSDCEELVGEGRGGVLTGDEVNELMLSNSI